MSTTPLRHHRRHGRSPGLRDPATATATATATTTATATATATATMTTPTKPTSTTALIAEDEPLLATALQAMLAQAWPDLTVVRIVHDGESAVDAIAALDPDVAFLDIRMPGLTGLEVAQRVAAAGAVPPQIVFVTAYDQYAVDAFEAAAVDYLLKPVAPERLERCVSRLRARLARPAGEPAAQGIDALLAQLQQRLAAPDGAGAPVHLRFIRASLGDVTRQIPVADVLYFEAQDKYVSVVTRDASALVRVPLSELLAGLDPDKFAQIHRSTIVNLDAIDTIRRDFAGRVYVHLRDQASGRDVKLAVSRQFAAQFKGM
ncbi:MAG: LytTR family DNA-binding domain-containing protein [Burkholderiaceae bacterium]